MANKKIITSRHNVNRASQTTYVTGFVISIVLTLIPFVMVVNDLISGWILTATLVIFALAQVFVQLTFFIHLGHERKPHWNRIVFGFMSLVLIIIVLGSLWIMHNLDYNMMQRPDKSMQNEGF